MGTIPIPYHDTWYFRYRYWYRYRIALDIPVSVSYRYRISWYRYRIGNWAILNSTKIYQFCWHFHVPFYYFQPQYKICQLKCSIAQFYNIHPFLLHFDTHLDTKMKIYVRLGGKNINFQVTVQYRIGIGFWSIGIVSYRILSIAKYWYRPIPKYCESVS